MCTAFGVLKDVNKVKINYDIQKKKHSLAVYILQYGIFFYNLTIYFQLLRITTWFISVPNINL